MPNNYILLETIALTQSAASVTFDNLPTSGYTDLKIVISGRTDRSGQQDDDIKIQVNGNTSAIYSQRRVLGNGSATFSDSSSGSNVGVSFTTGPTATANTFGSTDIYIPNYRSSANKSMSVDGVSENNATAAGAGMNAFLASTTSPITSITFAPLFGTVFVANSTFSLYGVAALGTTPVLAPKATGGNRIENNGTYWIHTFTSSGTFIPQTGLTCDYLVVAGGGAGGAEIGGGGGAGGLRSGSFTLNTNTSYPVTVGAGGAGASNAAPPSRSSSPGAASVVGGISASGGGQGGSNSGVPYGAGGNGGSGGGAGEGGSGAYGTGNAGGYSPVEGYNGGGSTDSGPAYGSGGGGGASAVGATGSTSAGGNGGAGTASSISGASVTYAGGGGGSVYASSSGSWGVGGAGGGGRGGHYNDGVNGVSGTANTGGGGGGGGANAGNSPSGGSGIVIIRYPIA